MKVRDAMQRQFASVTEDDSLALALQIMLWNERREMPVLRKPDGRLVGVIGERDILRAQYRHADENVMRRKVAEFMIAPPAQIAPNADLAEAARRLADANIGSLFVVEQDARLLGLLTTHDVLLSVPQLASEHGEAAPGQQTVSALMQPEPLTASEDESLLLLAGRMVKSGVRHACVIDGERRVIGIVSDRDTRRAVGDPRAVLQSDRLPEHVARLRVSDVMTRHPRTVTERDPLGTALDALLNQRFGALPVVGDDERLVGIVSYVDVLRHLSHRAGART